MSSAAPTLKEPHHIIVGATYPRTSEQWTPLPGWESGLRTGAAMAAACGGVCVQPMSVLGTAAYDWAVAGDTYDNIHLTEQGEIKIANLFYTTPVLGF